MFCREQVAQLVEWHPRFVEAGAQIVVIGNGSPVAAKAFAEERRLPFRLLTDPSLRTYDAAGAKRKILGALTPSVLRRGSEAHAGGFRQGATQGSVFQTGGGFLLYPDNTVGWSQISQVSGDHFDPAVPLGVLTARDVSGRTA